MPTFELIEQRPLPEIRATLQHYRHAASGAEHIHIAVNEAESAFVVGFPTLPCVSDGRAHILEHTVLCGSERYPTKDPFFSMTRRSVATFMNAMTYADRTIYPFATTDRLDYLNLMDVYLDATFFPRLDRVSFLQEGWRHVLRDGELSIQGVVFNEMKGHYADSLNAVHQGLSRALLAGTTYAVDSGGDPLEIPSLTHDQLRDFHASHYHPSQAVFLTSGTIDPLEVQGRIETQVLSRIKGSSPRRRPESATPVLESQRVRIEVPASSSPSQEYGLQICWLLEDLSDPLVQPRVELLVELLMGHAGAPLMSAMQAAGFGRPSRMSGADDSARQLMLHLGMEGLQIGEVAAAEACIMATLRAVAEDGMPVWAVEAGLRNLRHRLWQPEQPVERLIRLAPLVLRGASVSVGLDPGHVLQSLSAQALAPDFVSKQVRRLLNHPSRVVAEVHPNPDFFAQRSALEDKLIKRTQATLSGADVDRIRQDASALAEHQLRPAQDDVLPFVRPSDLAATPRVLPLADQVGAIQASSSASPGLSFCEMVVDVTSVPKDDWGWLGLYVDIVPGLGVKNMGFERASQWRKSHTPDFSMTVAMDVTVRGQRRLELTYSASALKEDQRQMAEVIAAWYGSPRFDESEWLSYLLRTHVQTRVAELASAASQYAGLAAEAAVSTGAEFAHRVSGLPSLKFLATVQRMLETKGGTNLIVNALRRVHTHVRQGDRALLCASDGMHSTVLVSMMQAALPATRCADDLDGGTLNSEVVPTGEACLAIVAPSQVNDCTVAFGVPGWAHPDAPALAVAAQLLTQQMLHPWLREQGGAYGARASYDGQQGVFSLSTHSDPRLAATFADIKRAIEESLHASFDARALDQAIISVIKHIEPPLPPMPELSRAWRIRRRGISDTMRQAFRTKVLNCTVADVRQVIGRWLVWDRSARAAAAGHVDQDLAGLQPFDLFEHAASLGLAQVTEDAEDAEEAMEAAPAN